LGPTVVPDVNLDENLDAADANLITCGAQATVPVVAALAALGPVRYAEIVSTVASRSAGPGTRSNIDEFTIATARSLETLGRGGHGERTVDHTPHAAGPADNDEERGFRRDRRDGARRGGGSRPRCGEPGGGLRARLPPGDRAARV